MLVRATLDLPLGSDMPGPLAGRRARMLGATLHWLVDRGASVTICGDAGASDPLEEAERLDQVRSVLVAMLPGVMVADTSSGSGPSVEDPGIIDALIGSHDLFVNESFQWSYLPLPSLVRPAQRLPSAVGRSLEHDLTVLQKIVAEPSHPLVAVLGGDQSFQRLHGLRGLVLRADAVLLGGAMALPMLQAIGAHTTVGASSEFLAECRSVYGLAKRVHHTVHLPLDLVWIRPDGSVEVASPGAPGEGTVVDIGPLTRLRFSEILAGAGSLLWTGALGQVEDPRFAEGSSALAHALDRVGGPTIVGGDALCAILDAEGTLGPRVELISATNAALELLKNGDLPALAALRRP